MLDVRRLRVLREVAQRGSFSAAAGALSYTQSAVSQQIAALEREAGLRLVERNARGVRLTDPGRALVAHADVILARLADAEAELEAMAGVRAGRLRLTSFATAGATLVPRAVSCFRERYPDVDLTLEPAEPDDGLERLRAGEADIALVIDVPGEQAADGFDRVHLLDDPMYVCLPRHHRFASRVKLRFSDLAEEDWVAGSDGVCPDCAILLRSCRAAGFEPRVAFYSDDYLAIQGFVAADVAVSIMPDLALVAVRDDVVIRRVAGPPPIRRISAATLSGGYRSPAAEAMLEILQEVGREWEADRRELALAS